MQSVSVCYPHRLKWSTMILAAILLLGSGSDLWAQGKPAAQSVRLTPTDREVIKSAIVESGAATMGELLRDVRIQEVIKKAGPEALMQVPEFKKVAAKETRLKARLTTAEHQGIVGKPNLSKILLMEGVDSRAALMSLDTRAAAEVLLRKYPGQPDIDPRTLSLDLQIAQSWAADKGPLTNPIIFIPGLMGSRLRDPDREWSMGRLFCGKEVWGYTALCSLGFFPELKLTLAPNVVRDRFQVDGLIDEVVVIDHLWTIAGYKDTLRFLTEVGNLKLNETLFVFPYDWRYSNVDAAKSLAQLVPEWKKRVAQTPLAGKKFVIVAHSMGGLIAKYYVNELQGKSEIERIVALGTPHLGAPLSLLAMRVGLPHNLMAANLIIGPETVRRVAFSMPSMFELLPLELRGALHEPQGPESATDLDLTKVDTWEKYGLIPSFPGFSLEEVREILRKRLKEAVAFRKKIVDCQVPIDYIVGPHHPTVASLVVSDPKTIDEEERNGDGTVPWESAAECRQENCLQVRPVEYVAMTHGDIHLDPDARQHILDLIKETSNPSKPLPEQERLTTNFKDRRMPSVLSQMTAGLQVPSSVSPVPAALTMATSYSDKRRKLISDIEYIETAIVPREVAPGKKVEIAVAIVGGDAELKAARLYGATATSSSSPIELAARNGKYYASITAPKPPGVYKVEFIVSRGSASLSFNTYFLVIPPDIGPPSSKVISRGTQKEVRH